MTLGLRPAVLGQGLAALRGGCSICVVLSGHVIPADAQHLDKHAGAVDQWMDTRAAAVSPGDGDFLHFEFKFSRQEESLRIESPALDFLQGEDRLHRRLLKGFETALRIFEFQAERDAQHQVENSAEDLTVEGLALGLGFGAQPARADRAA